jgi:hypothetical protein
MLPRYAPHSLQMCSEAQLILNCSRVNLDPAANERIRALLQHDLDWSKVVRFALRHRVTPLLYHSLHNVQVNQPADHQVPPEVWTLLQQFYHANYRRALYQSLELIHLIKLCKSDGIDVLPYKGPTQAFLVYKHLALRQFNDLDILVPKQDVTKAAKILQLQGYVGDKKQVMLSQMSRGNLSSIIIDVSGIHNMKSQ